MTKLKTSSWDSDYEIDKQIYSKQNILHFTKKNNMINSSDRTKNLAKINTMKVINSRNSNYLSKNNNYLIKNKKLVKYNSHKALLDITKGYYLLNKECITSRDYATQLTEANNTFVDLGKKQFLSTQKSKWVNKPSVGTSEIIDGIQTNFYIHKKKPILGLMSHESKLKNHTIKQNTFFLHKPIKQIEKTKCLDPKNILNKNIKPVNPHEIENTTPHNHYFPISNDNGNVIAFGHYSHKHIEASHNDKNVPPHVPSFSSFTHRFAIFPNNKKSIGEL